MQIYETPDGHLALVLPRMLGSRAKAVSLVNELPDLLDGITVEIIGTYSVGAHHAFVEEFCKQILTYRKASALVFVNSHPLITESAKFYSIVEGYSHRITFIEREEE